MRAPHRWSVASFAALLLAGALAAQKVVPPAEKRARALVNQLELAERRAAAADELLALGAAAVPALAARLNDPRPEVVQVVCEVLCALGPTAAAALPQLVTASGSPDAGIVRMVRMTEFRVRATGATTICEYQSQRIVELAVDGAERELLKGEVTGLDVLPDGHLLVAQWSKNQVVEYDDKGKEVWSFAGVNMPFKAMRLLDGHTSIVDPQGKRLVEVDAKGATVWEWKAPNGKGMPYDADRLANGRTLVCLYPSRVVEVNRAGEIVWELEELEGVFEADRLPNGNTLLTLHQAGAIREVNPKGEVVWEVKGVKEPRDADRLPNGNTLVGTTNSVIEFAPDGSKVSEIERGGHVFEVVRH